MNILLADDDPDTVELVTNFLLDVGHDVTSVRNGRELLQLIEREPRGFDVIVTDNNMPGGPSGLEVARKLRQDERYDLVPVVVHSNASQAEGETLKLRGTTYAEKSSTFEALSKALDDVERVLHYRSHP